MKENLLDVLMYLFENYLFGDDPEPAQDETALRDQLSELGFDNAEIDKAFGWLEDLHQRRNTMTPWVNEGGTAPSLRIYTNQEQIRLDAECRGFLLYLEQNAILDSHHREVVIDRVMALGDEPVSMEQLQWVILLVLFNQPGQEAAFAWVHDLVYADSPAQLH